MECSSKGCKQKTHGAHKNCERCRFLVFKLRQERIKGGLCSMGCGRPLVTKRQCRECATAGNVSNAKYRAKVKEQVFNHYGSMCACCGCVDIRFLTIDHVNNDGHNSKTPGGHRISTGSVCSRIIKSGYPDAYQILCYNCNIGKYRNNGVCPHEKR